MTAHSYQRVDSSVVEPSAHNGTVAGSNPARPTNPLRAGVCAQTIPARDLPQLPPASAGGAFLRFGPVLAAGTVSCVRERMLPERMHRLAPAPSADRRAMSAIGPSDHRALRRPLAHTICASPTTPALDISQAKEPVAIQPGEHHPFPRPAGGSSRPPAWRFAGRSCSAVTAEEAMSRSGWKPRTSPHFADAAHRVPVKAAFGRRRKLLHLPSAADCKHHIIPLMGRSKTRAAVFDPLKQKGTT